MSLEDILKSINKNVKGVHMSTLTDSDVSKTEGWIKTPSLDLNRILSGSLHKGISDKNLVGIVGPEHTMKSSFMILCMSEAIKQGFKPIIIDTERGVNDEFCKRWGLDLDKTGYIYTPWVDKVKSILASIKESGEEKLIIGIDSIGGLDSYKMYTDALKDDPKSDQGQLQKRIRSLLKLLLNITIEQKSIAIVTGHMYSSPDMFTPDQIGGGKAMKLFPSILISLKKKLIKDGTTKDSNIVGNEITATTVKNRTYPPFQQATVAIDYKNGINPYAGLLDLMVKANIIEKSGAWYSYKEQRLGQGAIKASEALKDFPECIESLEQWLEATGYSNINENFKEAEELIFKPEIVEENKSTVKKNGKKIKITKK